MGYEQFEHGADVGVRGFGMTAAQAFEGAARVLFALLSEKPSAVRLKVEERVEVEALGLEELLVEFLNELISLADMRGLVFGDFAIRIEGSASQGYRLSARVRGEPFDSERHEFASLQRRPSLSGPRNVEPSVRARFSCLRESVVAFEPASLRVPEGREYERQSFQVPAFIKEISDARAARGPALRERGV